MKLIFPLVLAIMAGAALHAQKPVKVNKVKTFNNNANTAINTAQPAEKTATLDSLQKAYDREMLEVVKTANGTNTNAAAAKLVYDKYKEKINLKPATTAATETTETIATGITLIEYNNENEKLQKKFTQINRLGGTVFPAYSAKWSDHWKWYISQGQLPPLREVNTDLSKGRIGFTADIRDKETGIAKAYVGFRQRVRIPNDPEVIAASFTFHYSFKFTGWDGPGAMFGLDLRVHAPDAFNSANYKALPSAPDPPSEGLRWKFVDELFPWTRFSNGVQEFHAQTDSSFTLTGYVQPNTSFDLLIGVGYVSGSGMSQYGAYHYGEFILKKIDVKFLKTLETSGNGG